MADDRTPLQLFPDWAEAPEIQRVMTALGHAGEARFIGGCVRDSLAGRPVGDIDVATTLHPDEVTRTLEAEGIKVVPTGIAHGTVTAVSNHRPLEITTLRRDVETDGRHAVVAFTSDWRTDASRRDFTINALSLGLDGELHDYFGGVEDLRAGVVRFIGEPEERIKEDYLRILRFFRFYARFGLRPPDAAALSACAALKDGLRGLSAERVWSELKAYLSVPEPSLTIEAMRGTGVLAMILPESEDADPRLLSYLEGIEDILVGGSPLRRLAAITQVEPGEPTGALSRRLRLSNEEARRLQNVVTAKAWHPGAEIKQLRAELYRQGRSAFLERLPYAMALGAMELNPPEKGFYEIAAESYKALRDWPVPSFPLSGEDAKALGLEAGPAVGRALKAVEAWWVAGDFEASRDDCLQELRRRSGPQSPV